MPAFELQSKFAPTGDQPAAIKQLTDGLKKGIREQTLLGVTGSGKTFTMANIIQNIQKPTLILAHNKALAAQLYSEFREFFPKNEVHYFVSYFDYYQPEAYIASTDTYIEKDSAINDEIDRLRHAATVALLTRPDTLIVASVSCIYGIGSPDHYVEMSLPLIKKQGVWQIMALSELAKNSLGRLHSPSLVNTSTQSTSSLNQTNFMIYLIAMQYHRNDLAFERGNFRVKGDTIDLFPASGEVAYRFEFDFDTLESVKIIDPLTAEILEKPEQIHIFPNTHYATPRDQLSRAIDTIKVEFDNRLKYFEAEHKYLEAQRLSQRTKYDLEMLEETGFVKGIENLPQVRGMYNGDHARKTTLVDYGFRLPSALDNRPLTFDEFETHIRRAIYVSATPGKYELEVSPAPAQQVIRPTGLLDPEIEVRKTEGQIDDLMQEIEERIAKNQRVIVTTLTKRMAEDLSEHLKDHGIKTAYIHSEIDTLERGDILRDLRTGVYDVLVGINLLREGLDLPEVSLVAILDADKEGFLRSESALIQTIGRAARHEEGHVIMYADNITESMERAITETDRRRDIQMKYNQEHGITPHSIKKEISLGLRAIIPEKEKENKLDLKKVPKSEFKVLIKELSEQMQLAAANLEYEKAAEIRDMIQKIKDEEEKRKS